MTQPITIALVGIGGYGNTYVGELLRAPDQHSFRIVGAIDPAPSSCLHLGELQSRNIPLFSSLEAFYAEKGADLAVISSPLQLHADQTCLALSRESNVLCEKPLCATPDDAQRMSVAAEASKKHVAIGYQWSFSNAIQSLKADIRAGLLGRPKRLRTLVLWPRDEVYYSRNRWAGRQKDDRGNWVLDSPANNACAHFLHNCFYILGKTPDSSAPIKLVTAELYRANSIQNYDTAAFRCQMTDGVEILFYATHAVGEQRGPVLNYEFERAVVQYEDGPGATMLATFNDGSTKNYGSPQENRMRKLWHTMEVIRGESKPLCGIPASAVHTHCIWAAQSSMPSIGSFPADSILTNGKPGQQSLVVRGLGETLSNCYEVGKLPSEMGVSWAKIPKTIPV